MCVCLYVLDDEDTLNEKMDRVKFAFQDEPQMQQEWSRSAEDTRMISDPVAMVTDETMSTPRTKEQQG